MIGRLIVIVLLCIVGLVGLGMSLCGGAFTFVGLLDSGSGGGEMPARAFLVIAVPSLLVGLAIVYGVVRGLRALAARARTAPGEPPAPGAGGEG